MQPCNIVMYLYTVTHKQGYKTEEPLKFPCHNDSLNYICYSDFEIIAPIQWA